MRGRGPVWVLIWVGALGYAVATGHVQSVFSLLLRVAS